jgi:hypothetical protein
MLVPVEMAATASQTAKIALCGCGMSEKCVQAEQPRLLRNKCAASKLSTFAWLYGGEASTA